MNLSIISVNGRVMGALSTSFLGLLLNISTVMQAPAGEDLFSCLCACYHVQSSLFFILDSAGDSIVSLVSYMRQNG